MIIELLGKPASGKSYIAEKLLLELRNQGISATIPENAWNKKSKFSKLLTLSFWVLINFGCIFNKDIRKALKYLFRYKKEAGRGSKWYFMKRFYIYVFLLKKGIKNNKNGILIFSECIYNLSAYVFRDNFSDDGIKSFLNALKNISNGKKLFFIEVSTSKSVESYRDKVLERLDISDNALKVNEFDKWHKKDLENINKSFQNLYSYIYSKEKVVLIENTYNDEVSQYINQIANEIVLLYNLQK